MQLRYESSGVRQMLRSMVAVLAGLLLISVIVESLEFALVTLVRGGVTTDPHIYFGVRNRPVFLAAKLVYNTGAAVVGGFVAAWLAPRSSIAHGTALAVLQMMAFGWALTDPASRQSTPEWMWVRLIFLTTGGIIVGSLLAKRWRK